MGFLEDALRSASTSPYSAPFTGPDEQRRRALALEVDLARKGQGVASSEAIEQAQRDQTAEFESSARAAQEAQEAKEEKERVRIASQEQLRKAGIKVDSLVGGSPLSTPGYVRDFASSPNYVEQRPDNFIGQPGLSVLSPSAQEVASVESPRSSMARQYAEDARRAPEENTSIKAYKDRNGKVVFSNQSIGDSTSDPNKSWGEGYNQIDYKDAVRGVREATRERAKETLAMPDVSRREVGDRGREMTLGIGPSQDLRNFAQELLNRSPEAEGSVSIPQVYEGPLAAQLQHGQLMDDMRRQLEFEGGRLAVEQSKDLQGKTPEERAYLGALPEIYRQPQGIGQDAARLEAIQRMIGEPSELEVLAERRNVWDAIAKDPNAMKMFNGVNDPKLLELAKKTIMDRRMQQIQERLAAFSSKDRIASSQNQF